MREQVFFPFPYVLVLEKVGSSRNSSMLEADVAMAMLA